MNTRIAIALIVCCVAFALAGCDHRVAPSKGQIWAFKTQADPWCHTVRFRVLEVNGDLVLVEAYMPGLIRPVKEVKHRLVMQADLQIDPYNCHPRGATQ